MSTSTLDTHSKHYSARISWGVRERQASLINTKEMFGNKDEICFEMFWRCFLKIQVETEKINGRCLELMLGFLFEERKML